ncbi:hypothetical protein ACFGVR_02370 [Mucilaginibacter sp. AW1-3]
MKKSNAKLSIPKVKSVYNYQQVKNVKKDDETDPITVTSATVTGILAGDWW